MTENEDFIQTSTVGERLRAAREKQKLSLDEIASQTRIPLRHLQNLETGDWSALPAPTYTIGFAKSYASAVGLDRTEIGDDLRTEMGGQRFDAGSPEVFEPADPARTMPKWLVFSAIGGIILVVLVMTWLNNRSLAPDEATSPIEATATAPTGENAAPSPSSTTTAACAGRSWCGHPDGNRTGLDTGYRRRANALLGRAGGGPDLCRAAECGRAIAEGRQA